VEEVAGHVQIGAQLLGRADAGPEVEDGSEAPEVPHPLFRQKQDGTLLAVVPIPGTGTSMAIVGYPVIAPGSISSLPAAAGSELPGSERTGLLLDHDQRRVWVDGTEVTLTFQEFELLAFLSAHPSTVFTRADLVRQVWQRDFAADSRTVDVHVSRLRHKLGPSYGRYLVTEYRVGYQFRPVIGLTSKGVKHPGLVRVGGRGAAAGAKAASPAGVHGDRGGRGGGRHPRRQHGRVRRDPVRPAPAGRSACRP
jgi:DNA-binding winged helix-turn-helix (wHTH) protein